MCAVRDGLVDPKHEQRYTEFGDWIRACYDVAVGQVYFVYICLCIYIQCGELPLVHQIQHQCASISVVGVAIVVVIIFILLIVVVVIIFIIDDVVIIESTNGGLHLLFLVLCLSSLIF